MNDDDKDYGPPPTAAESEALFQELLHVMELVIADMTRHHKFKFKRGEFYVLAMGAVGHDAASGGVTVRRTVASNLKLSKIRDLVFPATMPAIESVRGFTLEPDGSLKRISAEEAEQMKGKLEKDFDAASVEQVRRDVADSIARALMGDETPVAKIDKSKLN